MIKSNPSSQFLKSILYPGYPIHHELDTEESILRQLGLLNAKLHERLPISAPQIAYRGPDVTVQQSSATYSPPTQELRAIARGQNELNCGLGIISGEIREGVDIQRNIFGRLGTIEGDIQDGVDVQRDMLGVLDVHTAQVDLRIAQADVANRHAQNATNLLESLNSHVGAQPMQRLALLGGIYGVRHALQRLGVDLNQETQGIQGYQRENLNELRRMMPVLRGIEDIGTQQLSLAQGQARTLFDINVGITAQGGQLSSISRQLDGLSSIGTRACNYLHSIAHTGNFLVYTNLQIKKLLSDVLRGSLSPARKKSREIWQTGEAARQSGNSVAALVKFDESMDVNEHEPRNYFSAGLAALEIGKLNVAHDNFFNAFKLAECEDPSLAAEAGLQMAKIAVILGRPDQAKKMLHCAFNLDTKNIGIWYELALVELALDDDAAVRHYVNHILITACTKPQFYGYYIKLMNEPLLKPFI